MKSGISGTDSANACLLIGESAPHIHCGRTIRGMMLDMLIALIPSAALAIIYWGVDALRVMALAVAVAVLVEAACCRLMNRKISIDDLNAVVVGLLLAFMLPAGAAWWVVVVGTALSVCLGKMIFGGLGANPVPAVLVGYAAISVCWGIHVDPDTVQLATSWSDPLTKLKFFGAAGIDRFSYFDLLLGRQIGGLGSANVGMILLGGLYLVARGTVRWQIPLAFLVGTAAVSGLFYLTAPEMYAPPMFHLLTGSVMLAAFFIATDSACSPSRTAAMIIYGLLGGALVVLIRIYGMHVDGTAFAVLLASLVVPYCVLLRPKPFGVK